MKQLDYFFYPKNIAVIGASAQKDSIGKTIFENLHGNLRKGNHSARIFPVNPNHKIILGKKAYACIKDIPSSIDLAVIVVPAKVVPTVMRE